MTATMEQVDFEALTSEIHQIAVDHGFWDVDNGNRNFGEMAFLKVAELAEALEEHRAGRPGEWFQFDGEPVHRRTDSDGPDTEGADWVADRRLVGGSAKTWTGVVAKPEGIWVELADCATRCLDTYVHHLHGDPRLLDSMSRWTNWALRDNFGDACMQITTTLARVDASERLGNRGEAAYFLAATVFMCCHLAEQNGCPDFWAVARRKIAYNRQRPYLHGKAY